MRTTITFDAGTEALLRKRVRERGISLEQALNEAVRAGLTARPEASPFRTPTANLGLPAVNLDRALQLAAELEDEELVRKMRGKVNVVDANVLVRLATKIGLFPQPMSVDEATQTVRAWTAQPPSVILEPTVRHLDVVAGLLGLVGTGGNLVADAHLAALALEHDATVITYDTDSARFQGLRWARPPTQDQGS